MQSQIKPVMKRLLPFLKSNTSIDVYAKATLVGNGRRIINAAPLARLAWIIETLKL